MPQLGSHLEVQITANTDAFVVSMGRATASVKAFADALKLIPWYYRWAFALQTAFSRCKLPDTSSIRRKGRYAWFMEGQ